MKNSFEKRPYFGPRQIRTIRGINIGDKVIHFCEGIGVLSLLQILKFIISQGGFFLKVAEIGFDGYYRHEKFISLYDCNLMPQNGRWNPEYCLLKTKAKNEGGLRRTRQKNLLIF